MAKNFKKGDKVAILNSTLTGKIFVEATDAVVIRDDGDGQCDVRMDGGVFKRFVDPAAQTDPHAFAKLLNERMRA